MTGYSIIIPTYNESENITKLIENTISVIEKNKIKGEIIVVDDDSPDGTSLIVKNLMKGHRNLKLLVRKNKRGISSAIKDGVKISSFNWIITMDSDFSHPPNVIPKLIARTKDYDLVIASRFSKEGSMDAPVGRVLASKFINFLANFLLGTFIQDMTGGFQIFKKSDFNRCRIKSVGGEYSIELITKLKRSNRRIIEIPYVYRYRSAGESKSIKLRNIFRYVEIILKSL